MPTPAQSGQLQLTAALLSGPPRYALERPEDTEQIFDIDAKTGAILTRQALDRETAGWHNITVLAMEAEAVGKRGGGRGLPGGRGAEEGLEEGVELSKGLFVFPGWVWSGLVEAQGLPRGAWGCKAAPDASRSSWSPISGASVGARFMQQVKLAYRVKMALQLA
ncbi:cadherin-22 [Crotalus adamanteus]|uniref:Cadherin-22 n=1 Tax=Crotalus adamanteus TaxID=8729 RepID=A0AAW1BUD2_CROAD